MNQRHLQAKTKPFLVTIVGYGRYGNKYVGPKYARRDQQPFRFQCVVDPYVANHPEIYKESVLGSFHPDALVFDGFQAWYDGYFSHLSTEEQELVCIDIPIPPLVLHDAVRDYMRCGVKQVILPKPIAVNTQELMALSTLIKSYNVNTAVASQWHYSSFMEVFRVVLSSLRTDHGTLKGIERVEIEFSKEDGASYFTDPPLLELPHCLQILFSAGILTTQEGVVHKEKRLVEGTDEWVEIHYDHRDIPGGVHIRSDLALKISPETQVPAGLNCGYQKRTLNVYLTGDLPEHPSIFVDFWVKFDRSGTSAVRQGCFRFNGISLPPGVPREGSLVEDQLQGMIDKIFRDFQQQRQAIDEDTDLDDQYDPDAPVASMRAYRAIGMEIAEVNEEWNRIVARRPSLNASGGSLCHIPRFVDVRRSTARRIWQSY